jgi:hypothetical protein
MKAKRIYTTPQISSEKISIGVFGCYGGTGHHHPGGGNWGGGWFGGLFDFLFGGRKRR